MPGFDDLLRKGTRKGVVKEAPKPAEKLPAAEPAMGAALPAAKPADALALPKVPDAPAKGSLVLVTKGPDGKLGVATVPRPPPGYAGESGEGKTCAISPAVVAQALGGASGLESASGFVKVPEEKPAPAPVVAPAPAEAPAPVVPPVVAPAAPIPAPAAPAARPAESSPPIPVDSADVVAGSLAPPEPAPAAAPAAAEEPVEIKPDDSGVVAEPSGETPAPAKAAAKPPPLCRARGWGPVLDATKTPLGVPAVKGPKPAEAPAKTVKSEFKGDTTSLADGYSVSYGGEEDGAKMFIINKKGKAVSKIPLREGDTQSFYGEDSVKITLSRKKDVVKAVIEGARSLGERTQEVKQKAGDVLGTYWPEILAAGVGITSSPAAISVGLAKDMTGLVIAGVVAPVVTLAMAIYSFVRKRRNLNSEGA